MTEQIYAGEPVTLALDVRHRLICCDCSRTHDFVIERFGSNIALTIWGNAQATAARRRGKAAQDRIAEVAIKSLRGVAIGDVRERIREIAK